MIVFYNFLSKKTLLPFRLFNKSAVNLSNLKNFKLLIKHLIINKYQNQL